MNSMHLYWEQDSCGDNFSDATERTRCEQRYEQEFNHYAIKIFLQSLILLNCAYDSWSRDDELSNEQVLARKETKRKSKELKHRRYYSFSSFRVIIFVFLKPSGKV